jgi:hypothetical protein
VINSIVAGNTNSGDIYPGVTTDSAGNFIGGNPQLGVLANNGGPTQTMLPQTGSPVIDAIACTAAPATDQRGISRPQGTACDIGAVEVAVNVTPKAVPTPTLDRWALLLLGGVLAGLGLACVRRQHDG